MDSKNWRAEEVIAGNREALHTLRELIMYPFLYSREFKKIGLEWPSGLLLYGPPGTGKTSLVKAVVKESRAHLTEINVNSAQQSYAGESEKYLRESFLKAYSLAESGKPSVIFIDEIDSLCPRRNNKNKQEIRIVSQLLTLMDGNKNKISSKPRIVVVAATNRVDAIEPALRRKGRFDLEIEVSVPNSDERFQILKLYSKKLNLENDVYLKQIAKSCNGYVGTDLEALCEHAAKLALRKVSNPNYDISKKISDSISVKMEDFENAKKKVGPSLTRGVSKQVQVVTWDDIGGLKHLKRKMKEAVEWPIKKEKEYKRLGLSPTRGVLLHGPPGCSKTTLAKAAAHAAQSSFFSLSGAELYSKYVGEGEELLRRIFQKARLAAPSILFFDEIDAVAPKRGGHEGGNSNVGEKLLTTFLTEMDGLEEAKGVTVLGATNRPWAIDPALLRPGRFDLVLYVPPPDVEGRLEILKIKTKKMNLGEDVNLLKLAEKTELFTGADLEGLCKEACRIALKMFLKSVKKLSLDNNLSLGNLSLDDLSSDDLSLDDFSSDDFSSDNLSLDSLSFDNLSGANCINWRHFEHALRSFRPSLTQEIIDKSASVMVRK